MDRLIKENLEYLLQETSNTKRFGRRIISLAGFLGTQDIPEQLQAQLGNLSRLLIKQDAFDALLEPVTLMSRAGLLHTQDQHAMREILASLEEARKRVSECEDINYSQLINWLVGIAVSRKVIRLKSAQ
ncbi:TPA: hypothetical protein SL480_003988 [Pseudomonas aeruginosa]|uniref:hypothetical protein n=1 Tax=Pseudomonas aeruginosa TaxID=287 RepID=UPI000EAF5B0E|nr:hypothetical protein [Pseudomonas aeruginosa]HEJ4067883.1 hypothetical protein [Pseudomonas aeruginosa]HEJ4297711.1 hypothetical protein [Pseudomonas aeruginosa]